MPSVKTPLSTRGRAVVDADGRRVKLACVNWYGAHMELAASGGLHPAAAARRPCRHVACPVCVATSAVLALPGLLLARAVTAHFADPVRAMDADLKLHWHLDHLTVPLWIGEFPPLNGTYPHAEVTLGFLDEFGEVMARHDLDWAVWALNGDAWVARDEWKDWTSPRWDGPPRGTEGYRDEDAGLLDRAWVGLRDDDGRVAALQRLQAPRGEEQV